jgi:stage II sporulation protein P
MKTIARVLCVFLLVFLVAPVGLAEGDNPLEEFFEDDSTVYTMVDEAGNVLMRHLGRIYVDDEYISGDNQLYRVVEVDDVNRVAYAELVGEEPFDAAAFAALAEGDATKAPDASATGAADTGGKKLICMYSTHSDESYEDGDGTSSKTNDAGIYDVGEELKKNLEEMGITVEYSQETHLPHDAGAYRRSRRTAEELLKQQPAALIDLHRDGIPDPEEYAETVDGEEITKVRLLVGRSNANSSVNRAFAKEIKQTADAKYPGLIRDIFIGKGNYNQELYPKAILLEMGTHTSDKEEVLKSTKYIAEVLNDVIFGGSTTAKADSGTVAAGTEEENRGSGVGIAWLIGIAVLAAIIYALVSTGTLKGVTEKISRGASEMSGGLVGKKPDDKE